MVLLPCLMVGILDAVLVHQTEKPGRPYEPLLAAGTRVFLLMLVPLAIAVWVSFPRRRFVGTRRGLGAWVGLGAYALAFMIYSALRSVMDQPW